DLRAVDLRAVDLRAVDLRPELFRALDFRDDLRPDDLRPEILRADDFPDDLRLELFRPDFVRPSSLRSLLTVRAAISFARPFDMPRSSPLSLMCSYFRSSLLLHDSGMLASGSGALNGRGCRQDAYTVCLEWR